ncbi:hypothetical protein [Microbispora sp. NPDC049125]|uniref:hypothetical protein n=1 Tax=Microbispora sp. NPDC049125 TaxID=3154929 RepID=UPI003465F068
MQVALSVKQGTVLDIGCGTGYYLAGVLDQLPGARSLGLDTSMRDGDLGASHHFAYSPAEVFTHHIKPSEVSKKSIPASMAAWTVAIDSAGSAAP